MSAKTPRPSERNPKSGWRSDDGQRLLLVGRKNEKSRSNPSASRGKSAELSLAGRIPDQTAKRSRLPLFHSGISFRVSCGTLSRQPSGRKTRSGIKKHPRELAAVLHNLQRYLDQLNAAPNARAVQAGYLHHEPGGVVAVDQKSGGKGLQETRLYTFADAGTETVYLITLGDKGSQPTDVKFCSDFVKSLKTES